MRIGIIGAGRMGSALGNGWTRAGHEVLFSFSHDESKLLAVATAAGSRARVGTPQEAATFGEVTLLAVPWPAIADALLAAGAGEGELQGRILIDCTNPISPDKSRLLIGHTTSAAEEIARQAPGVRVVKAFNTIAAGSVTNPHCDGISASIFLCGDDPAAKAKVAGLISDLGFEPVDAGPLASARLIEPLGLLRLRLASALAAGPVLFKLLKTSSGPAPVIGSPAAT